MSFPTVDMLIWSLGVVVHASLLAVLVMRTRWRDYPLFTSFIAFQNAASPLLYLIYRFSSTEVYGRCFWLLEAFRFLLELAVTGEMFTTIWARGSTPVFVLRRKLILWSSFSLLVATVSAFLVGTPYMPKLALYAMRGSVFTSFFLSTTFVGFSWETNRRHLRRPLHPMMIGWGLTGIALLELSEDFRFFTHGWHWGSQTPDRIREVLYACIVAYWIVGMWHEDALKWPRARVVSLNKIRAD